MYSSLDRGRGIRHAAVVAFATCALLSAAAWTSPALAQKSSKKAPKGAPAAAPAAPFQDAVNAAYAKFKDTHEGKNADYIPALAKVDPNVYGVALITTDGKVYSTGDLTTQVSIQSISKVFTMARVIEEQGADAIENNMGVDATGQVFNSIVAVEQYKGAEMNAMVNPGATTATSMVSGASRDEIWNKIIGTYSDFAGRPLSVNQEVFKSEAETNQRNQAISMLMYAYGHIKDNPLQACDIYTEQCAVNVNAKVLAVMATAGLYDDSGKWLYATGLPAKSGVGGGILAVCPGKFGIAIVSPPLDAAGNSVKAQKTIAEVVNTIGANPYASTPATMAAPTSKKKKK